VLPFVLRSAHELMPTTIETLTSIWQHVLRRSPVRPDDNFFDLGGTDALADQIFSEIARVYGREIPSATIGHASTVATLAALLEQPSFPRFKPVVRIKDGDEQPPVFIAPGLSGNVQFFKLAQHISTAHAIYGIQAPGIDGQQQPLDRVEDMARFYIDSLCEHWPHGPYIVIGYSFGGLVALEMAQLLLEQKKTVGLLVLLDAYPHPRYLSRDLRRRLIVQRIKGHVRVMRELPLPSVPSYFTSRLKGMLSLSGPLPEGNNPGDASRVTFAQTIPWVKKKAYVAFEKYQPRFYPGKVKFVTTETKSFFPGDPTAVWGNLIAELAVDVIPGDHLDIATTKFEGLASVLTRYLSQYSDESFPKLGVKMEHNETTKAQ
jgi:thioesterase domain-containing protein